MRVNCGFRYYRAGKIAKLVAISNEVSFKDGGPLAPLQGHISSTGNADEMRVMWVSGKGMCHYILIIFLYRIHKDDIDISISFSADSNLIQPVLGRGEFK